MAKLSELVKGFRANVRNGIPTTLSYNHGEVKLDADRRDGQVGICRPKTTPENKGIQHYD